MTDNSIMKLYNLEGEFDETLRQYKQANIDYISVLQNATKNSNHTKIAEKISSLNQKLVYLNQKIIEQLGIIKPTTESLNAENKMKLQRAITSYSELLDEKKEIERMKTDLFNIDAERNDLASYFQYEYSQHIFWFFVFLVVIILTLKFVLFPSSSAPNPGLFIFWTISLILLVVSAVYSYLPAGFLILCLVIAYISLGKMGFLPIP